MLQHTPIKLQICFTGLRGNGNIAYCLIIALKTVFSLVVRENVTFKKITAVVNTVALRLKCMCVFISIDKLYKFTVKNGFCRELKITGPTMAFCSNKKV